MTAVLYYLVRTNYVNFVYRFTLMVKNKFGLKSSYGLVGDAMAAILDIESELLRIFWCADPLDAIM